MKQLAISILMVGTICLFSCDKDDISSVQKSSFIKFYTTFPEFRAADIVVNGEKGFAVLGTATTAENKKYLCLIRTDEFGNSIDTARIYGTANSTAYCLKSMDDGGYAILGSVINNASGHRAAYFVRTNSVGDTLWTKMYSRSGGDLEAKYFDVGADESFYMTGYYDTTGYGKQIWWMGVDNSGSMIRNQRLFGYPLTDDEGSHLEILPDGKLVITGYITRQQGKRPFIIKTLENTIPADFFEDTSAVNETGNCIRVIDAENFFVLGNKVNGSVSEITLKRINLTTHKVDWSKIYNTTNHDQGRCIIVGDQKMYILGNSLLTSSTSTITLTTTDGEGNELDRSEFGAASQLTASAFKVTPDGGFIIAGTNEHPEQNNTSLTLIKTNSQTGL